jgi:TPR repeat protein
MGLLGSILKSAALRKLRKDIAKAEAGDVGAQSSVGWTYAFGSCVPRDYAEAAKWFRKTADQGHRAARLNLGTLFLNGQGVEQDLIEAYKWIALARRPGPGGGHFVLDATNQFLRQVTALMTPEQIAEGQKLVDACPDDFAFKMFDGKLGKNELLASVIINHRGVAESLLAKGADVNAKNFDGLTPLHYSAARGYKSMVELLLANHADVHVTSRSGCTPLHFAVQENQETIAELLLANGAEVNAKDNKGLTPLHESAGRGHKVWWNCCWPKMPMSIPGQKKMLHRRSWRSWEGTKMSWNCSASMAVMSSGQQRS